MTVFPNGKHDDQVDLTAQFLDWFKTPMPCWGIFEHTRRMAEKLKPPEPVYVRVKVPPGIGSVQTFSGRHITIGEDRIVDRRAVDVWLKGRTDDAIDRCRDIMRRAELSASQCLVV
jgi:hypothetical protein